MPDQSNRTAVLNEIAFRARRSWRRTGEEYMEAAAALVEARDLCEHGEWGRGSRRRASRSAPRSA